MCPLLFGQMLGCQNIFSRNADLRELLVLKKSLSLEKVIKTTNLHNLPDGAWKNRLYIWYCSIGIRVYNSSLVISVEIFLTSAKIPWQGLKQPLSFIFTFLAHCFSNNAQVCWEENIEKGVKYINQPDPAWNNSSMHREYSYIHVQSFQKKHLLCSVHRLFCFGIF